MEYLSLSASSKREVPGSVETRDALESKNKIVQIEQKGGGEKVKKKKEVHSLGIRLLARNSKSHCKAGTYIQ